MVCGTRDNDRRADGALAGDLCEGFGVNSRFQRTLHKCCHDRFKPVDVRRRPHHRALHQFLQSRAGEDSALIANHPKHDPR